MDSSKIDRINELYHKSQSVGLTEEEKTEQAAFITEFEIHLGIFHQMPW